MSLSDFETGLLVAVLACEGHFGGDGKQPQITLRLHTRRASLAHWLIDRFPRTKLYGPYNHGGRSYYQWMVRGNALVHDVLPILEQRLTSEFDEHAYSRFDGMRTDYAAAIDRLRRRADLLGGGDAPSDAPTPD